MIYSMCAAVNNNTKYDHSGLSGMTVCEVSKMQQFETFFFVQALHWTDPTTNDPYHLLVVVPNWNRQQTTK
jgi:hypothetical protein